MIAVPPRDPQAGLVPPGVASGPSLRVPSQATGYRHPRKIPFVDWYLAPGARAAVRRARATGWMANGAEVEAFEAEFAAHVGARRGVAVSSGSTALELALGALRLPIGSRVLVSALSSWRVVQAVVQAGLRPLLLDVTEITGMPTPEQVREAAEAAAADGRPVSGMLVGHAHGDPVDVRPLAHAAGLPERAVVQDASEALGSALADSPTGGTGTVCFSFYSTTNLPVGDGGMVTTEYDDVAARVADARLRRAPLTARHRLLDLPALPYAGREGGLDGTLTNLTAAIGRGQLVHLDAWQRRRQRLAARYDARLADLPGLTLPHRPPTGAGVHSWHHYPVRIDPAYVPREVAVERLRVAGIGTGEATVPLHRLDHGRQVCAAPRAGLPGAEHVADRVIDLPLYPRLPEDVADRVAGVLAPLLEEHAPSRRTAG